VVVDLWANILRTQKTSGPEMWICVQSIRLDGQMKVCFHSRCYSFPFWLFFQNGNTFIQQPILHTRRSSSHNHSIMHSHTKTNDEWGKRGRGKVAYFFFSFKWNPKSSTFIWSISLKYYWNILFLYPLIINFLMKNSFRLLVKFLFKSPGPATL
jgi:hypothetical protein